MDSSSMVRLITILVLVIGLAGAAAVLLVLSDPGSDRPYPVSNSAPDSATASTVPSPASTLHRMPKLWDQDVATAERTIAALGFKLEIYSLTGDDITDPVDWVVVGQSPRPGDPLRSTTPIRVDVLPKDMPVPKITMSGSPWSPQTRATSAAEFDPSMPGDRKSITPGSIT
ncbi:PASTA domain-containing protein [Microbispora sp. H11081]|uniref:PASTA domain-containing protein n=1 Tax=Microbispora sp. H11081 TaxID=2729107 RepID=UPI00147582C1|nr:PASTA domain-containing protein [Microbispora sp. H11081]